MNDCCRWNSLFEYEYDELPKKICNACFNKLEYCWTFAECVAQAQYELITQIEDIKLDVSPFEYSNTITRELKIELVNDYVHDIKDEIIEPNESTVDIMSIDSIDQNEYLNIIEETELVNYYDHNQTNDSAIELKPLSLSGENDSGDESSSSILQENSYTNTPKERRDSIGYRALIKELLQKGHTVTQIKDELNAIFGSRAPALSTISFWKSAFMNGRTNIRDGGRSGRPIGATTQQNIQKVKAMISMDSKPNCRAIGRAIGISPSSVQTILNLLKIEPRPKRTNNAINGTKKKKRQPPTLSCLCDVCGKDFSSTDTLKRHKLIHSGELPHECATCSKRFRTRYNLKVCLIRCNGKFVLFCREIIFFCVLVS